MNTSKFRFFLALLIIFIVLGISIFIAGFVNAFQLVPLQQSYVYNGQDENGDFSYSLKIISSDKYEYIGSSFFANNKVTEAEQLNVVNSYTLNGNEIILHDLYNGENYFFEVSYSGVKVGDLFLSRASSPFTSAMSSIGILLTLCGAFGLIICLKHFKEQKQAEIAELEKEPSDIKKD